MGEGAAISTYRLISVWCESIACSEFVRPRLLLLPPNFGHWAFRNSKPNRQAVRAGRKASLHLRGLGNPRVMEVPDSMANRGDNADMERMG